MPLKALELAEAAPPVLPALADSTDWNSGF